MSYYGNHLSTTTPSWLPVSSNVFQFIFDWYFIFFLSAAQSKYTWNKILILKCSWTKPNASSARLFVFTPLDVQFWDSNISDENVKLFCTCSCQIACKPATQEQSWHQISECSLRWKKKTGPVFSCWCCDFRVWNRGGKKKMTSGRLVSLPHLHEKQEGISIPLSLSSIYSSCQHYLINDPMHYSKTVWTFAF